MSLKAFDKDDFHAPNAEINTTPLVDVMLVLMVIFLVTAPMLEQSIRLELPKTAVASISEVESITVSISKDGNYYWNSNEVSEKMLTEKLQEAQKYDAKKQILVRADANVKYASVAFLLAEASKFGLTNISFSVDGSK